MHLRLLWPSFLEQSMLALYKKNQSHIARRLGYVLMPTKQLAHAWKVAARDREQRRYYFIADTRHRMKGAQRPQHTLSQNIYLHKPHSRLSEYGRTQQKSSMRFLGDFSRNGRVKHTPVRTDETQLRIGGTRGMFHDIAASGIGSCHHPGKG